MASFTAELLDSIIRLPNNFIDIITSDPLSALLILFGAVFVGGASAVFGALTLGALVDAVTPSSATEPRREAR
jgi:hypothetical protein